MHARALAWPPTDAVEPGNDMPDRDMVRYTGHVKINVSEFKAKCLSLVEKAAKGEEVRIMKRGKVIARLVPDSEVEPKPWMALRATVATWHGDPFAPAVEASEIEAERQ